MAHTLLVPRVGRSSLSASTCGGTVGVNERCEVSDPAESLIGLLASDNAELAAAVDYGRICAVAAIGHRDLLSCAAAHPGLFPDGLFDPTMAGTLAFLMAFSVPRAPENQLRTINRVSLWNFAADAMVDSRAGSQAEVDAFVRRSLAVADGANAPATDPVTQLLAGIRDDLSMTPAFTVLRGAWRRQLQRMLDAMAREWEWNPTRLAASGAAPPTFEEYLPTAAGSIGLPFVYLSHWIANEAPGELTHVDDMTAACREVEPVLRLINDLGTYYRDRDDGDINALLLGVTREDVTQRMGELMTRLNGYLGPLRAIHPQLAVFLERQIGFHMALYQITDYRAIP